MVEVLKPVAPFLRRPPTPPLPKHESSHLPRPSATSASSLSYAAVNTPEDSPSSSAEYFRDTSGKTRKKVVISHRMEYHQPPSSDSKGSESDDLRRLPPSKECRSNRPILKPSSGHASTGSSNAWAFDTGNLPAMLQSAIQHMAADSLTSRLDAYSSLLACLSAYEDVPGSEELSVKVKEVTGYLKRDIALGDLHSDSLHVQLIAQALKLVVIFLCTPNLCSNIPDDFRLFIIERSISKLGDEDCPKPLMGHYMHILEKQKFGSRLVTVERVNRLLTNLDNPIARMKDSRILGLRLMIYLRLLGQIKSVMLARVESWLHHLVSGLLSSTRDIRARAISFGTEAGVQLGTSRSMSQAWLDMSNTESSEGKKVIEILHKRLRDWADSKEYGAHVPQIWSIPLLFLRSRRRQLEGWEHLGSWMGLLQGCFNSSDDKIKFSANLAWRRFIFAVNIDTDTSKKVAALLKVPIASQLERKGSGRSSKMEVSKQIPRDTYNSLLYYALRPSASQVQMDQYWDLYVADLIPKCFSESDVELGQACQILASLLFNNGPSRVWNEAKANTSDPIRVGELPTLDSKWVRSRVAKVMSVFDKLLHETDGLRNIELERLIALAWRNFTLALGHASSKEVKPSNETIVAVVSLTNQFKRLLDQPFHDQDELHQRYEFIDSLLREAITHLGHLAFNEKRLILAAHQQYEAASDNPSNRTKLTTTKPNSAMYQLLTVMLDKASGEGNKWYASILSQLVNSLLESAHSRPGRLAVLRALSRPSSFDCKEIARGSHEVLWRVISGSAISLLDPSHSPQSQLRPLENLGHEYRDAFGILEAGIAEPLGNGLASWLELYTRLAEQIKNEVGAAATALAMPATLLKTISNQLHPQENHNGLAAAVKIVESTSWPSSQHSLDRMQVLLWGANHGHLKSLSPDLTDDHYAMIELALLKAYVGCDEGSTHLSTSLITAVSAILQACPLQLKHRLLERIQGGLAAWLEDASQNILEGEGALFLKVSQNSHVFAIFSNF